MNIILEDVQMFMNDAKLMPKMFRSKLKQFINILIKQLKKWVKT